MRRVPVPALPTAARYAVVVAVAACIAYFSLLTAPPTEPGTGPWWDKKLHFVAYATLGISLAYATLEWNRLVPRLLLVVGLAFAFGGAIELVQWALPNRFFGVGDLVANLVGALLATGWLLAERYVTYVGWPGIRERVAG